MVKSFTELPGHAFSALNKGFLPVEIELKRFQGKSYYVAYNAKGKTRIAFAEFSGLKGERSAAPFPYFSQGLMMRAIQSVHPDGIPFGVNLIHQEDHYYYSKHNDNVLPVLRVQYKDAVNTWYYADPSTGAILLKNTSSARTSRWLYHGLHSLDFFNLQHYRPVWDVLVIVLLTGGTAVSITGLLLALKYLRKKVKL